MLIKALLEQFKRLHTKRQWVFFCCFGVLGLVLLPLLNGLTAADSALHVPEYFITLLGKFLCDIGENGIDVFVTSFHLPIEGWPVFRQARMKALVFGQFEVCVDQTISQIGENCFIPGRITKFEYILAISCGFAIHLYVQGNPGIDACGQETE